MAGSASRRDSIPLQNANGAAPRGIDSALRRSHDWRRRSRTAKHRCAGTLRRDSERAAGSNETRNQLDTAGACAGRSGRGRRRADGGSASRRPSPRVRRSGRGLRSAARDPLAAASYPSPGRLSGDAGAARGDHRGARLFPVRHQAADGEGLHLGGLRPQAHDGRGRAGPVRKMAARAQRDRDAARLSGHLHRPAGRGRHLRDPLRVGAGRKRGRPPDQP